MLAALQATGTKDWALERFVQCGSECVVEYCVEAKKFRLRANYCRCRHCEPCMRQKANKIAGNLRDKLSEKPDGKYRFITLTLRHNDAPLLDQIKRLYACFKKLRSTKLWKRSQRGGTFLLEVKWSKATRKWHPHLHIIGEGDFIRQTDLSRAWHSVTGDSQIVDVRALNSGADAAHYVSKYVTKGTNNDVWHDPEAATEWVIATRGVRTCATYGTWRGYKLTQVETGDEVYKPIATLTQVVQAAKRGETWATELLAQLVPASAPGEKDQRPKKPPEK